MTPFFSCPAALDSENSRRRVCGVLPGPGELLLPAAFGPRPAGDGEAVWPPFRRLPGVAGPLQARVLPLREATATPALCEGSLPPRRNGLSGAISADESALAARGEVMTTVGGVAVLAFILCLFHST